MKIVKKCLILILVCVLIGTLGACSCSSSNKKQDENATDNNHTNIVTESKNYFIRNGRSEYKILLPENPNEILLFAAQELNYFVEQTSGAKLEITTNKSLTADSKVLSIGNTQIVEQSNVKLDYSVYGGDGYKIVNEKNSVIMLGGDDFGSLYAVYGFVKLNLGAKVYASDEIKIQKAKTIKLMNFDVNEIPDIPRRAISSYFVSNNQNLRRRLRLVGNADNWSYWTHSHFALIPKETYFEEHPEYYSPDGTQLCLTNEGLINQMIENVITHLEATPTDEYITLGQQDVNSFCGCETCREQVAKYKESGVMVRFVNRVAEAVQKHFDENGSGRKINFATYAYQKTQQAPVDITNNVYTALDESVKPNKNVAIIIAPLTACYSHSLIDPDCNALAKQTIEGWASLGAKLYIRLYSAQYGYYSVPFIAYSNLATNYQAIKKFGAEYIFDTAVAETNTGGFHEMLAYVKSQLMWNASLNVRDLIDDFMQNYYKDAYAEMKELFTLYEMQWAIVESKGTHLILSTSVGATMFNNTNVFPRSLLSSAEKLIKNALSEIEPLKTTDERLYYTLKNRIESERTLSIYWQIELYKQYFTKTELSLMIDDFERICNTLNIDRWGEYNASTGVDKSISTLVSTWRTKLL